MIKKLQITRKKFFLFLSGIFFCIDFAILLKLSFFVLKTGRNFSIENQLIFTSIIFLSKINTNFSIENQLIFNCDFVLQINEKFSIEKQLICQLQKPWITLYFLYRDFQRHFFIDFAILLKLPFFIKNQHTFFYWKSIGFASIIFLLKINTKISIELPVHFQPAILYWKRIQFFLLKINWFFSASFFYWKLEVIFLLILIYMKLRFCIENQWKILYWKSIDLTASKT